MNGKDILRQKVIVGGVVTLNFNGKTELHEYAVLMCRAMSGEWEDVIPLLHAGRKG